MLPEKIYLVDLDKELVDAWEEVFENDKVFEPYQDDYFARKTDAIVSPANSFGIMDGGLDLAIRNEVGFKAEENLKNEILNNYHGELPIGSAIIVPTENTNWPFLISAPTMRIPNGCIKYLKPIFGI